MPHYGALVGFYDQSMTHIISCRFSSVVERPSHTRMAVSSNLTAGKNKPLDQSFDRELGEWAGNFCGILFNKILFVATCSEATCRSLYALPVRFSPTLCDMVLYGTWFRQTTDRLMLRSWLCPVEAWCFFLWDSSLLSFTYSLSFNRRSTTTTVAFTSRPLLPGLSGSLWKPKQAFFSSLSFYMTTLQRWINGLTSRIQYTEVSLPFYLFSLVLGFFLGNLFGTFLATLRQYIASDIVIILLLCLIFEYISFLAYTMSPETLPSSWQLRSRRALNLGKLGCLFGFFVDAFKVGS